jgi:hypothetical protein
MRTIYRKKPTREQLAAWRTARAENYAATRSPLALAAMIVELEDDTQSTPEFELGDVWPARVEHLRIR